MKSCSSMRSAPRVASRPPLAKKNIQAAKKATAKMSNASYAMDARRRARPGATLVLLAALLGREPRPGLHAPLHALLLLRLHARIALGDRDPLLPALGLERVPVRLERCEGLLLLGGELGARRAWAAPAWRPAWRRRAFSRRRRKVALPSRRRCRGTAR